ncbi:cell division protein [Thiorhodococcus mannitoliphagus]|uniref:Cell division protein FtsX n=1 Tax=Thiorhodococcus mannitoliphagus TaxID=329406 RepID=A0A6P1DU93_9GAMM|nr:permease-like cell division protein FtsX [Thiorhodococcus mannitoliphagus]NEX19264.1 cell division protein [Thiorhodococcus mannitoliphagus]
MAKQRSRRRRGPRLLDLPGIWLGQHWQTALETLGRLKENPLPSAMTVAVIGISLALPAALYVMTDNLRTMAGGWDQTAAISLFLRFETDDTHAKRLSQDLATWSEISRVHLITREQALEEFRALGGFEEALEEITKNPLPIVLAIYPTPTYSTPELLEGLQDKLLKLPEADFARMDTLWLQRFQAILDLVQSGSLLLGLLLGIGVLLIVGNTIRLEILNRRIEIEIMELVGATAAFIRRPFLYAGAWYGLLGGATAWLLVTISVLLLQQPVSRLASLYRSEFQLSGLGFAATGVTLGASVLLGLIGSWIAVNRHLRGAEPQ